MNTVESFAAVTQLEAKKTPAETYQTFYELYGEESLSRKGPHGWHVVLNRVLHFDQDDSRDVHVVVARDNSSINPPMRRRFNTLGLPMHLVPYAADDYLAASTDGHTITAYDMRQVMGVYSNHINGIDKQYDAAYEKLQLSLMTEQGKSSAEFQYASGEGVFDLQGYPTGWILSERESLNLKPAIFQGIGHTAVAS
jgi:hypothetical protein